MAARSTPAAVASTTAPDPGTCERPALVSVPIDETSAAQLAPLFKALGDPVRLRLLSLIGTRAGGEICVCDLTSAFSLSQPTISHHLKVLKDAGLIDGERRGTWVYYRLVPGTLEQMARLLSTPAA